MRSCHGLHAHTSCAHAEQVGDTSSQLPRVYQVPQLPIHQLPKQTHLGPSSKSAAASSAALPCALHAGLPLSSASSSSSLLSSRSALAAAATPARPGRICTLPPNTLLPPSGEAMAAPRSRGAARPAAVRWATTCCSCKCSSAAAAAVSQLSTIVVAGLGRLGLWAGQCPANIRCGCGKLGHAPVTLDSLKMNPPKGGCAPARLTLPWAAACSSAAPADLGSQSCGHPPLECTSSHCTGSGRER